MKKILLFLLLFAGMANAQNVNIPDPNFKAKLIAVNVDSNNNGEIEVEEAASVSYLDVSAAGISDMTGVEAFTGLTYFICFGNDITTLNLSNSPSLQKLYCGYNNLTILNVSGLTNIQELNCQNNQITTLDLSGFSNLTTLNCTANALTTLNLNGATNLVDLQCSINQITSLDLSGMSNLQSLNCSSNSLTSLNVNALTNLTDLNCSFNHLSVLTVSSLVDLDRLQSSNNLLTAIDVSTLSSLKLLDLSYNQLSAINVTTLVALEELRFNYNQITAVNLNGLTTLSFLDASQNNLSVLNLTGLNNLISLYCWNNQLTSLDVNSFANLKDLSCGGNQLTSLNVSALTNLENLSCAFNQLPTLNVSTLPNLSSLNCMQNSLTTLDLSNNDLLTYLNCSINQLTALDLSNLNGLQVLICGNNFIPNVNFSGLVLLRQLFVDSTGRTSLDVSNLPLLMQLYCGNNPIPTVDVSMLTQLNMLSVGGTGLTTLFAKNGQNEFIDINFSPNLNQICVDEGQLQDVLSEAISSGSGSATVTSYCTFTPGGNYNTITGLSKFDLDGDGCDALDVPSNNVKYSIANGEITEASLVNTAAEYAFFTQAGTFTVTPQLENPAYFTISPASAVLNFPLVDNSIQTQNFCLSANGVHPDLEIVLMPQGVARPGLNAEYQVVYKNKGNQTLSGTVNLIFDDAKSDFVAATPATNNQAFNSLIWNYENLQPFESRVIIITLNINSPLELPAVNAGDILNFTASINFAAGDDTPEDNISQLHQVAINSFDPNAKTCLEGDSVSPDKIGNYLHYNIEFENLGTAEAINVVVKDVIDTTMFDINSLQVLYASYPVRTTIRENIVEFIFENINLAPAAGDPPVGGHGNILFKIKTSPTLASGSEVTNLANIYFDYNHPIETNTARTTFETLSFPEFTKDESIVVYPNPANDAVQIKSDSNIKQIELFDIQGRILETLMQNSNTVKFDISGKTTGVYFIRITTEAGKKVEKLVKQ